MALDTILPQWFLDYMSPIILLVAGLLAVIIAVLYVKDKDSTKYKAVMLLGTIFGIIIVFLALFQGFKVQFFTLVLIALAAFTLIIRPFREIHIAAIIGLMAMVLMYIGLGTLAGKTVGGVSLDIIASGWGRIILAFVVGALIYLLLNFAEAIVMLFGKLLNCWPLLLILGLVCIAEAACIYLGYGSVWDLINGTQWK